MKGTTAIYKGRIVDKKIFRAFIYGVNGEKKLVESWNEFENHMQTGIWFASRQDALAAKPEPEIEPEVEAKAKPKSKSRPKPKPKPVAVEEVEEVQDDLDDGMVYEVKDNEF